MQFSFREPKCGGKRKITKVIFSGEVRLRVRRLLPPRDLPVIEHLCFGINIKVRWVMYNLYSYNLPRGEIIFCYNESATRASERIIFPAYNNADSTPKAANKIDKLLAICTSLLNYSLLLLHFCFVPQNKKADR